MSRTAALRVPYTISAVNSVTVSKAVSLMYALQTIKLLIQTINGLFIHDYAIIYVVLYTSAWCIQGNKIGLVHKIKCMHTYIIVLTTGQCCNGDGYWITSYSITNGDHCDVILHTRGNTSDVIAAPPHIGDLPFTTGRTPGNGKCEVHWFKTGLRKLPWERNPGLLHFGYSHCWSFGVLCSVSGKLTITNVKLCSHLLQSATS